MAVKAATPAWSIICSQINRNPTELKVELYRTGHPMGGVYSYSGLVFHNHYIFMAHFVSLEPTILEGTAGNLDSTKYKITLTPELLNTKMVLPAILETNIQDPFGKVSVEVTKLNCRGS